MIPSVAFCLAALHKREKKVLFFMTITPTDLQNLKIASVGEQFHTVTRTTNSGTFSQRKNKINRFDGRAFTINLFACGEVCQDKVKTALQNNV